MVITLKYFYEPELQTIFFRLSSDGNFTPIIYATAEECFGTVYADEVVVASENLLGQFLKQVIEGLKEEDVEWYISALKRRIVLVEPEEVSVTSLAACLEIPVSELIDDAKKLFFENFLRIDAEDEFLGDA